MNVLLFLTNILRSINSIVQYYGINIIIFSLFSHFVFYFNFQNELKTVYLVEVLKTYDHSNSFNEILNQTFLFVNKK